ncbi:hypothetical protein A2765_04720 [Candidatus Kaiserbacteria bacterium RIFCSPHIGHO2_01_FULL_56_24]|uniref:DUF1761 domain-containing protein n=1 Tax=Candidatus Kaiserbacteria bacterium RIFCSPHIGHO2_01_FULL_56_24 TaxID=1798487 RepID=A0A1F6DEK7_9BACT|nr:MAG: hypothetical protein A2765_04720 [Candidatus Kaiserbacteria bacterium RIFCSPHIGHO2_01_FULL_56_24]
MFEVTFIPILVAAIASAILGFIWFNPKVFGGAWMRMLNLTPQQMEAGKKRMPLMAFLAFLASMVAAYVLNYFGIAWGVFDWIGAVELGIWVWIGFVAPPMLGMILWERKSLRYYIITAGYWLVSFVIMAVILVLLA